MAMETDFHHENPRSVSVSQMLDHGSISFGRFTAESLAWERWSVFSHNRWQEELEKFKARGFVAQKKAYFEEYYKKVRSMKALEAEQKEAAGPGLLQDGLKSRIMQAEAGNKAGLLKEENNSSNISPIQTLQNDASAASDASLECTEKKQQADTEEVLSNLSCKNPTTKSLCATERNQSTKHAPKTRKSGNAHRSEILISNSVKKITNKSKNQGNVVSTGNMTKMGSRGKTETVKLSTKTKPTPHNQITVKTESSSNSSIGLGKSTTNKAVNGRNSNHVSSSHRKLTEATSGSTVRLTSLARKKLVTSPPIGKIDQIKPESNHRDSTNKFRRSVSNNIQPSQCSSKDGGSREQRISDRNKLNPKGGGGFSQRSCDRERKQEKGEDNSSAAVGRVSKSTTITPSSNHKNLNPVQKNTTSQPTNLDHGQKVDTRPKTPSWR